MDSSTHLLRLLESSDLKDVELGLQILSRELNERPSREVFDKAKSFLTHANEDIQSEAIWALCLHWGEKDTLPTLLSLLESRKLSPSLAEMVVRSIGRLGDEYAELRSKVTKILLKVLRSEGYSPVARGIAYLDCRKIAGYLTVSEYASSPQDINRLEVDWEWVKTLASD